jgi:hypothetical protein
MDVTPGPDLAALTLMLPAAAPPHRSPRREFMVSWWSRSALVVLVLVLGLLQGSRAALGDMSLTDAADAQAETPAAGVLERDALRGHFFRPAGSSAVRPALRSRQSAWTPASVSRLALACPDPSC